MFKKSAPFALFCALVGVVLSAPAVYAQSQATTGNIEGRVLDPKNAAVPGATVTAINQQTGLEKSSATNDQGDFSLILLPPGAYTVRATASGFAPSEIKDVTVTVGGRTPLEVALAVGGATASVTVTAEAPVVETTRTSVSTLGRRSLTGSHKIIQTLTNAFSKQTVKVVCSTAIMATRSRKRMVMRSSRSATNMICAPRFAGA